MGLMVMITMAEDVRVGPIKIITQAQMTQHLMITQAQMAQIITQMIQAHPAPEPELILKNKN